MAIFTAVFVFLLQLASAQLGDILSYKYQRYSECSSLLETCQPTISTCANIVCGQCTDLGQKAINSCCSQAVPYQCFISGGGGGSNYVTTLAPDANLVACSTALAYISECDSEIPGFSNLPNSIEASCLCYDSNTSWNPLGFDDPWSSCIAWAETADATAYSGLVVNAGMCVSEGDVRSAPASGAVASTTAGGSVVVTTTSANASPVGGSGSGTTATATASAAKSTASSPASCLSPSVEAMMTVVIFPLIMLTFQ